MFLSLGHFVVGALVAWITGTWEAIRLLLQNGSILFYSAALTGSAFGAYFRSVEIAGTIYHAWVRHVALAGLVLIIVPTVGLYGAIGFRLGSGTLSPRATARLSRTMLTLVAASLLYSLTIRLSLAAIVGAE